MGIVLGVVCHTGHFLKPTVWSMNKKTDHQSQSIPADWASGGAAGSNDLSHAEQEQELLRVASASHQQKSRVFQRLASTLAPGRQASLNAKYDMTGARPSPAPHYRATPLLRSRFPAQSIFTMQKEQEILV